MNGPYSDAIAGRKSGCLTPRLKRTCVGETTSMASGVSMKREMTLTGPASCSKKRANEFTAIIHITSVDSWNISISGIVKVTCVPSVDSSQDVASIGAISSVLSPLYWTSIS